MQIGMTRRSGWWIGLLLVAVGAHGETVYEDVAVTNRFRQTNPSATNYFDGPLTLNSGVTVSGAVVVARQGDVSMGNFTNGQPLGGLSGGLPAGTTGALLYFNGSQWMAMTNMYIDAASGRVYFGASTGGTYVATSGALAMSGNIQLNGRYISNDGGNEGLSVNDSGQVTVGPNASGYELTVQGDASVTNNLWAGNSVNVAYGLAVDCNTKTNDSAGVFFYAGNGVTSKTGFVSLDITGAVFRVGAATNGGSYVRWAIVKDSSGWMAGCSREFKHAIRELAAADYTAIRADFDKLQLFQYERNDVPGYPELGVIAETTSPWLKGDVDDAVSPVRWLGYLSAIAKDQERRLKDQQVQLDELRKLVDGLKPTK